MTGPDRPKVVKKQPAPGRLLDGTFAPGNKMGGRPALPEEFSAKGPEALTKLMAIALNDAHEEQVRALIFVAERIYGKAPQGIELEATETVNSVLAKIYAGAVKKDEP